MSAADITSIIAQERALVFARFDEAEAFALGCRLRETALERSLAIVIDVRLWDRPLFFAALPGTAAANAEWARRKINSVRHYQKASYRMGLEQGQRIFGPEHGLDPKDFVIAGGAFPIRVRDAGVVGAVAVSGLPQRDDHNLVVEVLAAHLGIDGAKLALPPETK